ncbi:hypothetical protein M407DRAFT_11131 [Tulasnella calospora MUT 4182]|uniref:Uncharacterized protein n=1 Tax=Tulasnella calospora MUT 4182 TaxID=1051891 RepID=A0A0C3Q8C6_9AGAM|nr:hypothetical protein M407DRAFT_11131 [Tulasnella calospora MUT 4182]
MSIQTGEDRSTMGLVPFLSTLTILVSNGATAFLVPDLVLSSTIPAPASRRHSAPVLASHWVEPPKGRWSVSYVTSYDEETLYNIAIRRPLNGTAKLVTRTIVTYIDPDDFTSSPLSNGSNAPIKTPVYGTPVGLGPIGFSGLELGPSVERLQPRATLPGTGGFQDSPFTTNQKRACLSKLFGPLLDSDLNNPTATNPDPHPIAPTFGPFTLRRIAEFPVAKLLFSIIEPCVTEGLTSSKIFQEYGILGVLAMVLVIMVTGIIIALLKALVLCSRTQRTINKLVSLYHAALVQVRAWVFGLRLGYEWSILYVFLPFVVSEEQAITNASLSFLSSMT